MAEITSGLSAAPLSTASAEDWSRVIFWHEMPTRAQWVPPEDSVEQRAEDHHNCRCWPTHSSLEDRLTAGFNETDGLE